MREAVIVASSRTPLAKSFRGSFNMTRPDELAAHVKRRLSAHAYPREVEFVESLPKTPSGKIQRFILRGGA